MQRFKNKSDVTVGSRVIFDNLTYYLTGLPRVRMVGEVKDLLEDNDKMILVELFIAGYEETFTKELPFYLLQ
jgi:hypothetical protein